MGPREWGWKKADQSLGEGAPCTCTLRRASWAPGVNCVTVGSERVAWSGGLSPEPHGVLLGGSIRGPSPGSAPQSVWSRLGPRHVNTRCIELRAHEYHVMVSSVGDSEVFDERESPEMTEALLLRLLSHRLKVLKRVLMRGDEDLDLIGGVRTLSRKVGRTDH